MNICCEYYLHTERFYGDFVKIDNSRWRVYHPTGHVDITSQGVQTWMYYVRDRLGSTRAVITEQGVPLQATDYYPSGIPVETYTTGNAYNTTDRLHTGKEYHAFDGLSWHDNVARFHDTLFPRFTTVDPLAEKYPDLSPYVFCNNNALIFVDPTGEKPTEDEAAAMACLVYGDDDVTLLGGWEKKRLYEDSKSGFRAQLFARTTNGKTEYVLAFAGTAITSLSDWKSDIKQYFGTSEQHIIAKEKSIEVKSEIGDDELTFVGHSLGGGLAATAAYTTQDNAITFNAAGLSKATINNLNLKTNPTLIDAYLTSNDELTIFLKQYQLTVADGIIHIENNNGPFGHSIHNFIDEPGVIKKAVNYINDAGVKFINNLENLVKSFTTFPF